MSGSMKERANMKFYVVQPNGLCSRWKAHDGYISSIKLFYSQWTQYRVYILNNPRLIQC